MQWCRLVTAIVGSDLDAHIVGIGLGILDVDVKIRVIIKDSGVDELVLEICLAARPVGID